LAAYRGRNAGWASQQAEEIIETERSRNFALIHAISPDGDGRRRLGPKTHCFDGRDVRSVAIARMHPGLIFYGPSHGRIGHSEFGFELSVLGWIGPLGVEPQNVHIGGQGGWRTVMQMLPYRVPNETRSNPAIRQP
jgi:hypothetical protein